MRDLATWEEYLLDSSDGGEEFFDEEEYFGVYCDRCEEGIDLDNYSLYTLAKYKNSEHVYKALKVLCTPCADELIEFMDTRDNTPRLTREQAAILTAFTGITCGPFEVFHEYAQKLLGRPVWTHEFAGKELVQEIKERAQQDFLDICYSKEEGDDK